MNADEKLREILRAEADVVEPSPAGWDRITDGIAVRRRRRVWLRSSLAAATAVSLVAVVAVVATSDNDPDVRSGIVATQPPPSDEPAPTATTSPGPPVSASQDDPLPIVWPLTTQREINFWRANPASRPALRSAETAAKEFVLRYLALEDVRVELSDAAQGGVSLWSVSRLIVPGDERSRVFIATVWVKAGSVEEDGPQAPYLVSHVESGDGVESLTITSPTNAWTVTSPVTVKGTVTGVDESVRVEVRAHNPAGAAGYVELAKAFVPAGAEQPWETTLTFAEPPDNAGAVYASTASPADGKLSAVTVVPVTLDDSERAAVAQPGAYPERFAAVESGRIAVFETKTGRRIRYLTQAPPGAGASDPSATDDALTVVFVQGGDTCATSIRQVPTTGDSPPETLISSVAGRVLSMPAYNRQGDLAYLSTSCDARSPQQILVNEASGAPRRIELGLAETTVRAIAWRPDGEVLAVITTSCCDQTTELRLVRQSDKQVAQGELVRSDPSCLLADVAWSADSDLITASTCRSADDGNATSSKVQQQGETDRVYVTTPSYLVDALAVDPSGDHVLLGGLVCSETCEGEPTVRRFSVDGEPVPVAAGITQPVWVG